MDETEISDLVAQSQIRAAMMRYCRGVDRKDFTLMRTAYHADAYDDHGDYRGGVDGLIEWVMKRHEIIDQSTHFLGNMAIEVLGDVAFVETYAVVLQHKRSGVPAGNQGYRRLTFGCRYVDRFEKREGQWRIAHHIVVYEWKRDETGDDDLDFASHLTLGRRSREDPVYTLRAQFEAEHGSR